jgi:hypothetical protein
MKNMKMKTKIVIGLLVMLLSHVALAQKIATSFQDAVDNKGISIEKLDAAYQSALHSDSTKAAFKGQEKEFTDGYISLLQELSSYLKANNFTWGKQTRCFNRIYLNKNGEIDYFLFNFKEGELDKQKEEEFKKLLNTFIQTYQFPLKNTVNFAQCSPVKYADE